MGIPLQANMPQGLDLGTEYEIVFSAINATTGDLVDGVLITTATIHAAQLEGTPAGLVAPGWLPVPLDEQ